MSGNFKLKSSKSNQIHLFVDKYIWKYKIRKG